MISIALCDDETKYLNFYNDKISKLFMKHKIDFEIIKFSSGESLLFQLEDKPKKFQIFILDIVMKNINGIDTALEIKQLNPEAKIIFLTSSAEFVFKAFDANPINYIIKSVDDNKLDIVLEKVIKSVNVNISSDNFVYETKNINLSIPYNEIMYFETFKRIIYTHIVNKKEEFFYSTFKELETKLIGKNFLKIHRSFIVNMQYIHKIFNQQVELKNGTLLPISRGSYADLKTQFSQYLNAKI